MYGTKKDPLAQPLPVSLDAPLQERMYAESVSDVVERHAAKTHDLKPFGLHLEAEVPYEILQKHNDTKPLISPWCFRS